MRVPKRLQMFASGCGNWCRRRSRSSNMQRRLRRTPSYAPRRRAHGGAEQIRGMEGRADAAHARDASAYLSRNQNTTATMISTRIIRSTHNGNFTPHPFFGSWHADYVQRHRTPAALRAWRTASHPATQRTAEEAERSQRQERSPLATRQGPSDRFRCPAPESSRTTLTPERHASLSAQEPTSTTGRTRPAPR